MQKLQFSSGCHHHVSVRGRSCRFIGGVRERAREGGSHLQRPVAESCKQRDGHHRYRPPHMIKSVSRRVHLSGAVPQHSIPFRLSIQQR